MCSSTRDESSLVRTKGETRGRATRSASFAWLCMRRHRANRRNRACIIIVRVMDVRKASCSECLRRWTRPGSPGWTPSPATRTNTRTCRRSRPESPHNHTPHTNTTSRAMSHHGLVTYFSQSCRSSRALCWWLPSRWPPPLRPLLRTPWTRTRSLHVLPLPVR